MGLAIGDAVGLADGWKVDAVVGDAVGLAVGEAVGIEDGWKVDVLVDDAVSLVDGWYVDKVDGFVEGRNVGLLLGWSTEGLAEGRKVGFLEGLVEGWLDGLFVGFLEFVGAPLGLIDGPCVMPVIDPSKKIFIFIWKHNYRIQPLLMAECSSIANGQL